jgi:hypothetical protein
MQVAVLKVFTTKDGVQNGGKSYWQEKVAVRKLFKDADRSALRQGLYA